KVHHSRCTNKGKKYKCLVWIRDYITCSAIAVLVQFQFTSKVQKNTMYSVQKIVAVLSVIALASASIDDSHHHDVHTTHSEVEKHVPVPVYEKVGIPIPHPVPVAVPNYVKVGIPQPYPVHVTVQQPIQVPIYKVVPQIIEKAVPVPVEKPYPVEIQKPYPVEVIKKIEVPVPKPYPVPFTVYKHILQKEKADHKGWH
uniref:Uncharacterized protein n=1 Tax=Phlebotomus papatasi TaxID=29031 RepID=A0A1B0DIQ7_PHLPP